MKSLGDADVGLVGRRPHAIAAATGLANSLLGWRESLAGSDACK